MPDAASEDVERCSYSRSITGKGVANGGRATKEEIVFLYCSK